VYFLKARFILFTLFLVALVAIAIVVPATSSAETPTEDESEPAGASSAETPTEDESEPAGASSAETPTEESEGKKDSLHSLFPLLAIAIPIAISIAILIYVVMRIVQKLKSTPDFGSQINPNIHNQDFSTNIDRAAEGEANDNLFDVSELMRNLASRITSLENSIETTAILRKQKEGIEEDLKKYVTGYNLSIFKMAAIDLIDAYEYLLEALGKLEELSSPESKDIRKYLVPVGMYLKQGLTAVGIEQFMPDKDVPYTKNQSCELSRTTPTTDKGKEGLIENVEKCGWRSILPTDSTQQVILRSAKVSVFERLEK